MFQLQDSVHFIVEDTKKIIDFFKRISSKLSSKYHDTTKSQEITMIVYPHIVSLYARTQAYPIWIGETPSKFKGIRFIYQSNFSPFQRAEFGNARMYLFGGRQKIYESDFKASPDLINAFEIADTFGVPEKEQDIRDAWTKNTAQEATAALENILGIPLRLPENIEHTNTLLYEGFKLKIYQSSVVVHAPNYHKEYARVSRIGDAEKYASIHIALSPLSASDISKKLTENSIMTNKGEVTISTGYLSIYDNRFRYDNVEKYAATISSVIPNPIVGVGVYEEWLALFLYNNGAKVVEYNWDESGDTANFEWFCREMQIPKEIYQSMQKTSDCDGLAIQLQTFMGVFF